MPSPVFQEWLNQNSYRSYPFREDANLAPAGVPDVVLPNYLLVDMVLTVAGNAAVEVRLANLAYVGGFLTMMFADAAGNSVANLAVDTSLHVPFSSYPLAGLDLYEDARGAVTLGNLARLPDDLPDGAYAFAAAALEQCVVRPDLRGVRSIRVGSGDALSDYVRGHVKLIEGTNIRLTYLPNENGIRIDAIDGTGTVQACDCEDLHTPNCITSINGIPIDDLQIVGDGHCVEVTVSGNRIVIRDKCSEPCCGCPELEFITANLRLEEAVLRRVEAYAQDLQDKVRNTLTAILNSTKGG